MSNLTWWSIGGLALAFAAPALAANSDGMANCDSTPGPAQAKAKADLRYCAIDQITGSRSPRKTCKTRKAWLVEGMDPLIR